jgi:tRNA A-37 threonylcarbamoyl transferase component Bud32
MPDRASERLIADRYALAVPIGQGGMGVVWRAQDTLLGREVAIKEVRLPPTIPDSERSSMRARVLREARAAARLNHPGVVTLYDVINEQGHAFIVMELINAPTLAQVVAQQGPLEPRRAARIGAQVAAALAAAHQAGIVHRDVKPANVMVLGDSARLTDFGIARVKGDPKLTSTGLIVGSPAYMAPEQASGAAAGPEADLWGLGATLYYAVEGRPPFERDGQIAILTAVVNDAPRAPERAGELAPVIVALLSKDPAQRPSAAELRELLERAATAEPAAATITLPAQAVVPVDPTPPAAQADDSRPETSGPQPAEEAGEPAELEAAEAEPAEAEAPAGVEAAGAEPARAEPADLEAGEAPAAEAAEAPSGDTEQLPEVDEAPVALPPPPPGKPAEVSRPGPSRPRNQGPNHVRPDQPARPARSGPPRQHPPMDGAVGMAGGPPGSPALGAAALAGPAPAPTEAEPSPGALAQGTAGGDALAHDGAADGDGAALNGGAARPAGGDRPALAALPGRVLGGDRRPVAIALLAVVVLLVAAFAIANAFRSSGQPGGTASDRSQASATTKARGGASATSRSPASTKPPASTAPATTAPPSGGAPAGWATLRNSAGAYSFAYPPGWHASSQSDSLHTATASGPDGQLFKVQSSDQPSDPMRAWTEQERSFSSRPGYQKIRLEAGSYQGLDAAVWEFTQLEGGQQVHKLDITFKRADGRWGYAVLLQSPERSWSQTSRLAGEFERGFATSG